MTFIDFVYQLVVTPIENIMNLVFNSLFRMFETYEIAIIGTSIVISFLTLPLFQLVDKGKLINKKGELKKTNSICTSVIVACISVVVQIPLIVASVHYFSSTIIPSEIAWLSISDIKKQDELLSFSNFQINLIPFVVLIFHSVAAILRSEKGLLSRIYWLFMAIGYCIILYDKPFTVNLFWTINSFILLVYSSIYSYSKKSYRSFWILLSGFSIFLCIIMLLLGFLQSNSRKILFMGSAFLCQIPLVIYFLKAKGWIKTCASKVKPDYLYFLVISVCLSILVGILVPSTVVKSSPTEYMQNDCSPITILIENFANFAGLLILWESFYYWRLNKTGRSFLLLSQWILMGICFLNFFFFNKNGVMNPNMTYSKGVVFWKTAESLFNVALMIAVSIVFILLISRFSEYTKSISIILLVALGTISILNLSDIVGQSKDYEETHKNDAKVTSGIFELSKKGKNVVFVMLDRAASDFIPFIIFEKPKIEQQLAGFTFYSNTLSQGQTTNYAAPAAYGGYEYTPTEMNRKSEQLLKDKHNEALLLLPTIFADEGFTVTTCDPPYADYKNVPDLRIFNGNENIKAYNVLSSDLYKNMEYIPDMSIDALRYNFNMYSIMKIAPAMLQGCIYDDGLYGKVINNYVYTPFLKSYTELEKLDYLTSISETNTKGSLLMIYNAITHEPVQLQLPEYEISRNINNNDKETFFRTDKNGNVLDLSNEVTRNHYYVAVKAFQLLGKWFDFLRENGVYDNTKIILVGDHSLDFLNDKNKITSLGYHIEQLNPILLVKDYSDDQFKISEEFMTIADVPTICMEGIVDNPINPFTKIEIESTKKYKDENQNVIYAVDSFVDNIADENNIFLSNDWYMVENDTKDISKWHKIDRPYS